MADLFSKKKRSEIMSLVRSKNTKPEIALRKLLGAEFYPAGYRYRLHYKKLPGSPDIAFISKRIAVFVDGGFWHGYRFKKWEHKLEAKYWLPKIRANMKRDKAMNRKLKMMGWKVIRIWEHDLRKNPGRVLDRVRTALRH